MESYILLHNTLYATSNVLIQNLHTLLNKLQIEVAHTQNIVLENKFLPYIAPIPYYMKLVKVLQEAKIEGRKLLVCDTESLLAITYFFKVFYKNADMREALSKACGEIDILDLETTFVFAPQVLLTKLDSIQGFKKGRWNGFKCAFILDRELEDNIKESQLIAQLERLTGLKISLFFKESYAYLLQSNPELAYQMGAMDYYTMLDSGVDFIITANIGNFELMDKHIKQLQNRAGRDTAEIPILFIPQVILAIFEEMTAKALHFNAHTIKPQML